MDNVEIKAVKDAGIRAFAGFQEFHYGQLETRIDAVKQGNLGDLHLAQIEYYNDIGIWTPQHWWAKTKAIGGSSMQFFGCHSLMMMMNIMEGRRIAEIVTLDTHSKSHHFAPLEYKATQVNLLGSKTARSDRSPRAWTARTPITGAIRSWGPRAR